MDNLTKNLTIEVLNFRCPAEAVTEVTGRWKTLRVDPTAREQAYENRWHLLTTTDPHNVHDEPITDDLQGALTTVLNDATFNAGGVLQLTLTDGKVCVVPSHAWPIFSIDAQ